MNEATDLTRDLTIRCVDCATPFVLTVREQEFFAAKGLQQPRRCQACRAAKRERNARYEQANRG